MEDFELDKLAETFLRNIRPCPLVPEGLAVVPPLPDKSAVMHAFHVYKDPLLANWEGKKPPLQRTVKDPTHLALLSAALQHHPDAPKKIGPGVRDIIVRRTEIYISPAKVTDAICCIALRVDGSEEDFSIFRPYGVRSRKDDGHRFNVTTGELEKRNGD